MELIDKEINDIPLKNRFDELSIKNIKIFENPNTVFMPKVLNRVSIKKKINIMLKNGILMKLILILDTKNDQWKVEKLYHINNIWRDEYCPLCGYFGDKSISTCNITKKEANEFFLLIKKTKYFQIRSLFSLKKLI